MATCKPTMAMVMITTNTVYAVTVIPWSAKADGSVRSENTGHAAKKRVAPAPAVTIRGCSLTHLNMARSISYTRRVHQTQVPARKGTAGAVSFQAHPDPPEIRRFPVGLQKAQSRRF